MKYAITKGFRSLTVDVPGEQRDDRVRIPLTIYNALWWDRLFNTTVEITRYDGNYQQVVFYWPARKMDKPEAVVPPFVVSW